MVLFLFLLCCKKPLILALNEVGLFFNSFILQDPTPIHPEGQKPTRKKPGYEKPVIHSQPEPGYSTTPKPYSTTPGPVYNTPNYNPPRQPSKQKGNLMAVCTDWKLYSPNI